MNNIELDKKFDKIIINLLNIIGIILLIGALICFMLIFLIEDKNPIIIFMTINIIILLATGLTILYTKKRITEFFKRENGY